MRHETELVFAQLAPLSTPMTRLKARSSAAEGRLLPAGPSFGEAGDVPKTGFPCNKRNYMSYEVSRVGTLELAKGNKYRSEATDGTPINVLFDDSRRTTATCFN